MKRSLWLWSVTWPIVRQTQMKNRNHTKIDTSKQALRTPKTEISSQQLPSASRPQNPFFTMAAGCNNPPPYSTKHYENQ